MLKEINVIHKDLDFVVFIYIYIFFYNFPALLPYNMFVSVTDM